jgi:hypothetical protein
VRNARCAVEIAPTLKERQASTFSRSVYREARRLCSQKRDGGVVYAPEAALSAKTST